MPVFDRLPSPQNPGAPIAHAAPRHTRGALAEDLLALGRRPSRDWVETLLDRIEALS